MQVRWGIIGCGDVTEVKSGPALQRANNSSLLAVMRRRADLAQDYARRHSVPAWYDSAQDLINDPQVNAVYIATPPAAHMEYTLLAARAKKPVYVEKPMALDFAQCQEMIRVCQEEGVPLFVAYYRRALPRFLKIKQLLEKGAIGQVRAVTCRYYRQTLKIEAELPWRVQPQLAGGGLLLDVGSHTLDILDFLLGPISQVSGLATNQAGLYPAEDMVSAHFLFPQGVHGTGQWCFTAGFDLDENEIIGSAGKITFSTFADEPVLLQTKTGRTEYSLKNPLHIQQPLIQTIVDELGGQGQCPSTGSSAARTSWVMDQLIKGYYQESKSTNR